VSPQGLCTRCSLFLECHSLTGCRAGCHQGTSSKSQPLSTNMTVSTTLARRTPSFVSKYDFFTFISKIFFSNPQHFFFGLFNPQKHRWEPCRKMLTVSCQWKKAELELVALLGSHYTILYARGQNQRARWRNERRGRI
jgi:hypothetical protein